MSERKCKTVSFDLSESFERELLDYAESKGKFSKYIKRLIDEDRRGVPKPLGSNSNEWNSAPEKIIDDRPDAYTMEAMGSFL